MYKILRSFTGIIIIALLFANSLFSQTSEEKKLLKSVQKHYNAGEYKEALNAYKDLIKINPKNFNYQYELALIYYHELNEKEKSIPFFHNAREIMRNDSVPELYFLLAQAYQADGAYEKAIETFYYYRDIDSNFLKVNVKKYVELCNYGIELLNNPDTAIELINIGHPVNTKYDEYTALKIPNSNELLFTSRKVTNMFGELIEAIFITSSESGTYTNPVPVQEVEKYKNLVVDPEEHLSIVNISDMGKKIYLYSNSMLYASLVEKNIWQEPKKLHDNINFNFSNRHCSFTKEGKEVYFSSFDRKDQNNIEIYYSKLNDEGVWSEAIEVGKPINTLKNDDAPEISAKGDTLYFASNGHKGMGGYDIFMSVKNDSIWSEPVNLGTPVNSPWDDIYFKFNPIQNEGFLSSDRKGGLGGMDIYIVRKK